MTDLTFTTDAEIKIEGGLGITLDVSSYKWLTQPLLAAQQQYAVRPYMKVKIIDDSIIYDRELILQNDYSKESYGKAVIAPDGKILAAGRLAPMHVATALGFWKITDGSIPAQWENPPAVTLDTIFKGQATIEVSDWINGQYVIDIYWLKINGGTSHFEIWYSRSTDSGATFSSGTLLWDTGVTSGSADGNISVAAGKPQLQADGTVNGAVFWTKVGGSSDQIESIAYKYFNGTSWDSGETLWSPKFVDTSEWLLHSLDVFTHDGAYDIIFSGYHKLLESTNYNFSLYQTQLTKLNGDIAKDIWQPAREVLASLSPSTTNRNSYIYPTFNFDGENLWLVFQGLTVDTMSESKAVAQKTNYFLMKSVDFVNFSYPTAIAKPAADNAYGLEFVDVLNINISAGIIRTACSFVKQGNYYFLSGNAALWRFPQKNIVADVSLDVVKLNIQESAGAPSALTLEIGNQNSKWVGPSPTETGYQAIAKNKKVMIYLGYYNADGIPEVAPRSTFLIDDIQQNVSSNRNDLIITARDDCSKRARVTVTRFPYSFEGVDYYADSFDGSTLSNWNQMNGTWEEESEVTGAYPPFHWIETTELIGSNARNPGNDVALITLSGFSIKRSEMMNCVLFKVPAVPFGGIAGEYRHSIVYAYWQDEDNWLRTRIFVENDNPTDVFGIIELSVAGVITTPVPEWTFSTSFPGGVSNIQGYIFPLLIQQFAFTKYRFTFGRPQATVGSPPDSANNLDMFEPYANQKVFDVDLDFVTNGISPTPKTLALGAAAWRPEFRHFKFCNYDESLNIKELMTNLATKAGTFKYQFENLFEDRFFDASLWSGTFTLDKRKLTMTANNEVRRTTPEIADGEVEFEAKLVPTDPSSDYGFDFIFRSKNFSAYQNYDHRYLARIQKQGTDVISAQFWRNGEVISTPDTMLISTAHEVDSGAPTAPIYSNLNIDLTQYHKYKVLYVKNWVSLFIDNQLVLAWYDDEQMKILLQTLGGLPEAFANGKIGFKTLANTTLVVKSIKSTMFFPQVAAFGLSPGDDIDSSIGHLIEILRSWHFSDLFGRFKAVVLKSTDPSSYSYQDQLWMHSADQSDKEYANQVTVVGDGVSAVARDNPSIGLNVFTREAIIVDYKITTLKDAQTRAQNELNDFNKFNSQIDPKQIINLGAEVFDVVHIKDVGLNSSGIDKDMRVYNQTINVDGHSNDYSIQLGTGTII